MTATTLTPRQQLILSLLAGQMATSEIAASAGIDKHATVDALGRLWIRRLVNRIKGGKEYKWERV